jgi:hypothetical protein
VRLLPRLLVLLLVPPRLLVALLLPPQVLVVPRLLLLVRLPLPVVLKCLT